MNKARKAEAICQCNNHAVALFHVRWVPVSSEGINAQKEFSLQKREDIYCSLFFFLLTIS